MKKTVVYILVLIILISIAGIIYFTKKSGPFGKSDSDFKIDDISKVTKIVLTSGRGKVELTKISDGWQVDKKFNARKNSVEFLLNAISKLKIKSPVSNKKFLKETKTLTKNNIVFVEIYKGFKRSKSFTLYKVNSNPYGNYVRKKKDSDPYVLYIPGYDEPLGSLFPTIEKFWKPYLLFDYPPGMIKEVKMEYPDSHEKSFHIIKSGNNDYKLLFNNKEAPLFDTLAVERYLSYFRNVSFERWEMDSGKKDSVIVNMPGFILTVTDTTGDQNIIKTFSTPDTNYADKDLLSPVKDEVFIMQNDGDGLRVAKYFNLDPVIKVRDYFL